MSEDEDRAAFEQASARVSFQLSYQRSPETRRFDGDGITGPWIDDARTVGGSSPGEWSHDYPAAFADEAAWLARFFEAAVNEAVHEALEWFHVDGEPVLDPHGPRESEIYGVVNDMAKRLWDLRIN